MQNNQKIIGILGGMGPFATLEFFHNILNNTPAKKDWEHLHLVIDNNPHIPSRSRYYLYGEASPVPAMIEACQKLAAWPVDLIAIPCNSASYFLPEVQKAVSVPILNIMQVAVAALKKQAPKTKTVLVLGGRITYAEQTYAVFLKEAGMHFVQHDLEEQKQVEHFIDAIKLNQSTASILKDFEPFLTTLLKRYKVDAVMLGCTEFACILHALTAAFPKQSMIDSNTALAHALIKQACI